MSIAVDQVETTEQAKLQALWQAAWPPGVPREPVYPHGEVPLSKYLRRWAVIRPDKPAVIFYGNTLSFRELDQQSDRFAALLASRGIRPGDRVSVMLSNCPQFHVVFFGILKRGAIYAPVSPMCTAVELEYQLNDCGATALVTLDSLMPLARQVLPRVSLREIFVTSYAEAIPDHPTLPLPPMLQSARIPIPDAIDLLPALQATAIEPAVFADTLDAPAALNYTGGTTGMPKGCIHTQRDMVYTAAVAFIAAHFDENTVVLSMFPEFWIAGENFGLIFPAFAGAPLVLLARWDPLAFMMAVDRYKVSTSVLTADSVFDVLDHPDLHKFDLRSFRDPRAVSFVKTLTPECRARWKQATGGADLLLGSYGMTETHTGNTFTKGMQIDNRDLARPGFVGLPMPGVDFKICDFESHQRLPLDTEGEIWIRAPGMMKGYWNNEIAKDTPLVDGWFKTGDIGMIDSSGYLYYRGRRKEMLKVKGMSVFPAEIEAMLGRHPSVLGCAVVGIADAEHGQRPMAFVVLNPGSTGDRVGETLSAWCREVMAAYKVPLIRIVDALPLTATGKIQKTELAKWV